MTIYIAIKEDQAYASKSITGLAELIGASRNGTARALSKGSIKGYKLYTTTLVQHKARGISF